MEGGSSSTVVVFVVVVVVDVPGCSRNILGVFLCMVGWLGFVFFLFSCLSLSLAFLLLGSQLPALTASRVMERPLSLLSYLHLS